MPTHYAKRMTRRRWLRCVFSEEQLLNGTQQIIPRQDVISHAAPTKLVPNIFDVRRLHLRKGDLQFCFAHGIALMRVQRATRFRQTQPYSQTSKQLRARTNDPVEVRLRKDANCGVYGKAAKNLAKRTDIISANSIEVCRNLIANLQCLGSRFRGGVGRSGVIEGEMRDQ